MLHIFHKLGMPSEDNVFIFNGDLVDRGDHSCELVLLLFALKLSNPNSVFVNRGNHEEPHINIYSGFEEECIGKYDHRVFQMFHAVFVWLPYACTVNGKTLVLHAGLPADSSVTVEDIRQIARGPDVCSEELNWGKERWIRDLLWSDPHPDPAHVGIENSARGAGVLWGEDVTRHFFNKNNLTALVRSHQCVEAGVDVAHGERVYTVFSASNYCGTSGNLGAVLIQRHGCDKPTETYQWDPAEDAKMSGTVVSKRKSKEMRKEAAVTQATEYIIEHRAALLEYYKRSDLTRTGSVSFHTWAKGLSQVLQVRVAWNKLVSGLVGVEDMDDSCDCVLYEKWLGNFEVELKGGCREWQHEVVGKISAAVFQSGGDLQQAFKEMDADGSGEISPQEFRTAVRARLPSLAVLSDAQLEAVSWGRRHGRLVRLRFVREVAWKFRSGAERRVPRVAARGCWENLRGGVPIRGRPSTGIQGNGRGRERRDFAARVSNGGTGAFALPGGAFRRAAGSGGEGIRQGRVRPRGRAGV